LKEKKEILGLKKKKMENSCVLKIHKGKNENSKRATCQERGLKNGACNEKKGKRLGKRGGFGMVNHTKSCY